MVTGLRDLIHAAIEENPDLDARSIAAKIAVDLDLELVVELIAQQVEGMQREATRNAEMSAFAKLAPSKGRKDKANVAALLSQLNGRGFRVGDHIEIPWLDATIEDHEARISFLMKQRSGIDDTIARHQEAIERIRAAGADCLRDLMSAAG